MIGWDEKYPCYDCGNGKVRGVGVAMAMQGSGISGVDTGAVEIKVNDDGFYSLMIGATDMGTGCDTILTQMAAECLECEKVIPFERTKRELWIQFPDKETFLDEEQIVYGYLADSEGEDEVIIYCAKERAVKRLPKNRNIQINEQVLSRLMNHFGESRVKVVEKAIENHF